MKNLIRVSILILVICLLIPVGFKAFDTVKERVATKSSQEVIIGQVDWKPVSDLSKDSPIYLNSTGVGYVKIRRGNTYSRCTGFKVSKRAYMTNWHCSKNSVGKVTNTSIKGMEISFDYVDRQGTKYFKTKSVLAWSKDLDFALLETFEDLPGKTLKLSNKKVESAQFDGYVINQNCDYFTSQCLPIKQYDNTCKFKSYSSSTLTHWCDTLGGSSGSPFFNENTHEVVGIHYAGVPTSNGRGTKNFAKRMHKIYPMVEKHLDNSHSDPVDDPNAGTPAVTYKYLFPSKTECTQSKFGEYTCKVKTWRLFR